MKFYNKNHVLQERNHLHKRLERRIDSNSNFDSKSLFLGRPGHLRTGVVTISSGDSLSRDFSEVVVFFSEGASGGVASKTKSF